MLSCTSPGTLLAPTRTGTSPLHSSVRLQVCFHCHFQMLVFNNRSLPLQLTVWHLHKIYRPKKGNKNSLKIQTVNNFCLDLNLDLFPPTYNNRQFARFACQVLWPVILHSFLFPQHIYRHIKRPPHSLTCPYVCLSPVFFAQHTHTLIQFQCFPWTD